MLQWFHPSLSRLFQSVAQWMRSQTQSRMLCYRVRVCSLLSCFNKHKTVVRGYISSCNISPKYIHMYIASMDPIRDVVEILPQCPVIVNILVGKGMVRFYPSKMEWLLIQKSPDCRIILFFTLTSTQQVCKYRGSPLRAHLEWDALRTVIHTLIIFHFDCCNVCYLGLLWRTTQKFHLA